MKKIKTAELADEVLDYAVALALGHSEDEAWTQATSTDEEFGRHRYSTNPNLAWTIIDSERICVNAFLDCNDWNACTYTDYKMRQFFHKGPTSLIAAMRCFVASKLGDEVEVPEELLQ